MRNNETEYTTVSVREDTLKRLKKYKDTSNLSWDEFFRHYADVLEEVGIETPLDYWSFVCEYEIKDRYERDPEEMDDIILDSMVG